jgi:D-beta-D-heptose 7-phosphate kinase/D-beta-D-heptose 1-phosphate adenosyltransferase
MGFSKNKEKIIWTNGCFDILHLGHVRMLEFAKSLGDRLVVGIDTDERVKVNKGKNRPINKQEYRAEMLRSLKFVNEVVFFDSVDSLKQRILESGAELIVVGREYEKTGVIGSDLVPVVFFDRILGISSSLIIENINTDRDI